MRHSIQYEPNPVYRYVILASALKFRGKWVVIDQTDNQLVWAGDSLFQACWQYGQKRLRAN